MYNPADKQLSNELSERVDAAIAAGIRQAQARRNRRRNRIRRRLAGAAAACMLLFACLFTIRVSPVFAAMVRDIPGLETFVEMIRHNADKGVQLAVDNDFVQPVHVTEEHDGMKLTVKGVIADESRMVLFYEIEVPGLGQGDKVQLDHPGLSDVTGNRLKASIGFNYPEEAKQDIGSSVIQRGTADFSLAEGEVLPDEVVFQVKLKRPAGEWGDFRLQLPIDRARFAGLQEEYVLNQSIQVEGQTVTFTKAVVSPLHVSLYMEYGEENTKQIFGAGDIRLVDEKGQVWAFTSASMVKDHPIYRFESPYFVKPSSLRVEGSWFRALDKDRLTVKVNTETKQVIEAPDGKIALFNVTRTEEYTKLDFAISGLEAEDRMMYSLFEHEFVDADGHIHHTADFQEVISGYEDGTEPDVQHSLYYIDNEVYVQPLTFKIYHYPQYIHQPYEVRIK